MVSAAGDLPADFDGLPIPETDDPKRYVADVTRASGSSFILPILLLARPRREAMLALYAFCRETDDVADEIEDDALSSALIKAWAARGLAPQRTNCLIPSGASSLSG